MKLASALVICGAAAWHGAMGAFPAADLSRQSVPPATIAGQVVDGVTGESRVELQNREWVRQTAKLATPVEINWDRTASVTLAMLAVSLKR